MVVVDVIQDLDYEGVPFQCHHCHSMEHLVAQCIHPFHGRKMCEGKREWTKEVGDSKKAQELSVDKRASKDTFQKLTVGMVP